MGGGTQLFADIDPKVIRTQGTEELLHLRATVPPDVLADPRRFNELGAGLPPGKFHYSPGR